MMMWVHLAVLLIVTVAPSACKSINTHGMDKNINDAAARNSKSDVEMPRRTVAKEVDRENLLRHLRTQDHSLDSEQSLDSVTRELVDGLSTRVFGRKQLSDGLRGLFRDYLRSQRDNSIQQRPEGVWGRKRRSLEDADAPRGVWGDVTSADAEDTPRGVWGRRSLSSGAPKGVWGKRSALGAPKGVWGKRSALGAPKGVWGRRELLSGAPMGVWGDSAVAQMDSDAPRGVWGRKDETKDSKTPRGVWGKRSTLGAPKGVWGKRSALGAPKGVWGRKRNAMGAKKDSAAEANKHTEEVEQDDVVNNAKDAQRGGERVWAGRKDEKVTERDAPRGVWGKRSAAGKASTIWRKNAANKDAQPRRPPGLWGKDIKTTHLDTEDAHKRESNGPPGLEPIDSYLLAGFNGKRESNRQPLSANIFGGKKDSDNSQPILLLPAKDIHQPMFSGLAFTPEKRTEEERADDGAAVQNDVTQPLSANLQVYGDSLQPMSSLHGDSQPLSSAYGDTKSTQPLHASLMHGDGKQPISASLYGDDKKQPLSASLYGDEKQPLSASLYGDNQPLFKIYQDEKREISNAVVQPLSAGYGNIWETMEERKRSAKEQAKRQVDPSLNNEQKKQQRLPISYNTGR